MKRYVDRHLVHLLELPFTEDLSHRLLSLSVFIIILSFGVSLLRK